MVKEGKVSIISEEIKQIDDILIEINENNEYRYTESNNTKVVFNLNNCSLIRKNNDLYMKYIFDEKKETLGRLKIKSLDKEIQVNIKTIEVNISDKKIEIKYQIENDIYIYEIEME